MIDFNDKARDTHLDTLEYWYRGETKFKIIKKIENLEGNSYEYDVALYAVAHMKEGSNVLVTGLDLVYIFPNLGRGDYSISVDESFDLNENISYYVLEDIVEGLILTIKNRLI